MAKASKSKVEIRAVSFSLENIALVSFQMFAIFFSFGFFLHPRLVRKARESNDVLRELGWEYLEAPVVIDLEPARF